ncbi:hypothetical protein QTP70_019012, partial [Hemibagrus guttatus]
NGLWDLLNSSYSRMKNATGDATVEVQRYLNDPNIHVQKIPCISWLFKRLSIHVFITLPWKVFVHSCLLSPIRSV